MTWLKKALPAAAYQYLQRQFGVPPHQDRSRYYTDVFTVLRISPHQPRALILVTNLVHSFHRNNPEILRCELHFRPHVEDYRVVNLSVRFTDNESALGVMIDGMSFKEYMLKGQEHGLWEVESYEHGHMLLVGFDRGRSGQTRLLKPEERQKLGTYERKGTEAARGGKGAKKATVKQQPTTYEPKETLKQPVTYEPHKLSKKRPTIVTEAGPSNYEEIEMVEMSGERRGKGKEVDIVAADHYDDEMGGGGVEEETETMEEMSDVRRGKQPER
ncbi:MAG: hypothetical protein Q9207_003954 [Kuettlingeria erythrocarpa]